jgi:hypothetical protein
MGRVIFMPQGLARVSQTLSHLPVSRSHSRTKGKQSGYTGTAPKDNLLAEMEQWGLAVNGLRGPLSFQQGWDAFRLDTWL